MIIREDVPLVGFMCLVYTCLPGESHHRWLGSLLLCSLCMLILTLWVLILITEVFIKPKSLFVETVQSAHSHAYTGTHMHTHRHLCMHAHTHTQIIRQQRYNLHRNTKSKQLSKSQDSPHPHHTYTHTHTQPGETKGRVGETEREAVQAQRIWFSIVNFTFDCCQWQSNLRERDQRGREIKSRTWGKSHTPSPTELSAPSARSCSGTRASLAWAPWSGPSTGAAPSLETSLLLPHCDWTSETQL